MESTTKNGIKCKITPIKELELKDFLMSVAESAMYFPELCEIKRDEWFREIMKIITR